MTFTAFPSFHFASSVSFPSLLTLSHSTTPIMEYSNCKKPAQRACIACKSASVLEGDPPVVQYCARTCQDAQWTEHKTRCDRLRDHMHSEDSCFEYSTCVLPVETAIHRIERVPRYVGIQNELQEFLLLLRGFVQCVVFRILIVIVESETTTGAGASTQSQWLATISRVGDNQITCWYR